MADSTDGRQTGYRYDQPTKKVNTYNQNAEDTFWLEFKLSRSPQFEPQRQGDLIIYKRR